MSTEFTTQDVPALPAGKRPETGPMRFQGDWTGVFIRGDHALMGYLPALNAILASRSEPPVEGASLQDLIERSALQGLCDLLASCIETGQAPRTPPA